MEKSLIVKIEKSGNRFNAWDADGNKHTSSISISARKRAFEKGMALEQRVNKSGKNYWWVVPMSEFEKTSAPTIDLSSVEVPSDHAEILNFIHSSYTLKPKGLFREKRHSEANPKGGRRRCVTGVFDPPPPSGGAGRD